MGLRAVLSLLLLVLAWSPAPAADLHFPPPSGRVVDQANILSEPTRRHLDDLLARDEAASGGRQIVVVTLASLEGDTIEDYGYRLGRFWGIGQKGASNGALLIVVPSAREVRIEVGYGLEGTLTDAASRTIIEQVILPAFRRGDYDGGVQAGTVAILRLLGSSAVEGEPEPAPSPAHEVITAPGRVVMIILFIVLWIFLRQFFWPLFLLGGLRGGRGGGHGGDGFGGGSGDGGFSGGGFSGGGFSGGGFSGGGGSFGGGGATGRW